MLLAVQSDAIGHRHRTGRNFYVITFRVVLISLVAFTGTAQSFENLTAAQNLVYGTAHLSNTVAGQQINYRYHSQVAAGDIIADRVSILIKKTHENNKRDVILDFLDTT